MLNAWLQTVSQSFFASTGRIPALDQFTTSFTWWIAAGGDAKDKVTMHPLILMGADLLALFFLLVGLFFLAVGAIGMVRLPDVFNRMHAVSKCSTLGLMGLLLAAVLHVETLDTATKAGLTLMFAFVAAPVGTHVLAKALLATRQPMWDGTLSNDHE